MDMSERPQDDIDEPGEECGRWANGCLTEFCSKAGSEECDFECPYRNGLNFIAYLRGLPTSGM
jgi:hypothetical protein